MIVGTAGHIDHGKTSLVRALTGVDTDRLKEEKARGVTIELGFAYIDAPDGSRLGFVDAPGHEKFVRTMVAGASGIDFALIAVAADDGVMPQTREHVAILDLLGVTRGLVALTKVDIAEPDRREAAIAGVGALLAGARLRGADILPVSTVTGEGVAALKARLFAEASCFRRVATDRRFRLAIDRSFTLRGAGAIVTGAVLGGTVREGDRVTLSPSGVEARVRGIHAQDRSVVEASAGIRAALNLAGPRIDKDRIARGEIALDPALHAPSARIDAGLDLIADEGKPVGNWTEARFHCNAAEVPARIAILSGDAIAPGKSGFVQLVLARPIAAASHDRFILRDAQGKRTIGGGVLLDLRAPRRRRRTEARLAQLRALAFADPAEALSALLAAPPFIVAYDVFVRDRAMTATAADALARRLGLIVLGHAETPYVTAPSAWATLEEEARLELETFHAAHPYLPGLSLDRLRLATASQPPAPAFRAALAAMSAIAIDGAWVRLRSHEPRLSAEDEELWTRISSRLGGAARFRPPRVRDISEALEIPEPNVRRLMKFAARLGRAQEIAPDHFFLRETVAEMAGIASDLARAAEGGAFAAAGFRDRLGNGRKVAIEILEYFDRHGLTIRRGDLRRVDPRRRDLFGGAGDRDA
jgi:selenocysteine-specific elongation factor